MFDVTFFDSFFHHDFLSKPLQFTANLYFRSVSSRRNAHFCILNSKTHMFCSIPLFPTFFFIMIFFQNQCNLQQIYTFGRSRYSVVLTLTKTSLFTYDQAPFFQGGRPWGAYRSRGVQIPLFQFLFLLLPRSEIDDCHTLQASGPPSGRHFYKPSPCFT